MKWIILLLIWLIAGMRLAGDMKETLVLEVGEQVVVEMRLSEWPEEKWGWYQIRDRNLTIMYPTQFKLNYADRVRMIGKVDNEVIKEQYKMYTLKMSDVEILQENQPVIRKMMLTRNSLERRLERWLPGEHGALVSGILLGGNNLGEKTKEAFRRTGLTHILAASGYNVSVVAGWVMLWLGRVFGRRRAMPFVILSILLYMFLAGMSAAVIRAGIMGMLIITALSLGRRSDGGWMLGVTAGLMLIWRPVWVGDVGWQLSVAAMGGLIWVEPKIKLKWSDLNTTLAATVTTVPIIMHHFGSVSVVSPIVNGVVLWMVPPIMQFSALALAGGLVWEKLGQVLVYLVYPLTSALLGIVNWVGSEKWVMWETGKLGWGWVAGYYGALVLILHITNRRKEIRER